MKLTAGDLRFMGWVASYTSPFGALVDRVSPTLAKLARHGLVAEFERRVVLTGVGWQALLRDGFEPKTDRGFTLEQLLEPTPSPIPGRRR